MIKKKRTKTTIEKRELYLLRKPRGSSQVLCAQCEEAAALVTLEEAVKIASVSSRVIYRLIEDGRIHFAEGPEGLVLICPASLLRIVTGSNLMGRTK